MTGHDGHLRCCTSSEVQQPFGRFLWQVIGQIEKGVLGWATYCVEPIRRNPTGQQHPVRDSGEQRYLWRGGRDARPWHCLNFHPFGQLDQLRRPGRRMALDPAPFRPGVGGIVMPYIAEEEACLGLCTITRISSLTR